MIGDQNTCLRCGYQWPSRVEGRPRQCPGCKSPQWDQERKRKRRAAVEPVPVVEADEDPFAPEGEAPIPEGTMLVSKAAEILGVSEERVWERALSNQKVARPRKLGDGRRVIEAAAMGRRLEA